MMARMLSQLPLPLLPAGAAEIAPGVGLLAGEDGGLVIVHGLATFAWDAGDEAGRRLAAVQLVRLRAASQGQVAEAFGVDPATIWRWDQALAAGGVAGLVPSRRGPKGASKLTRELVERIAGLDAAGATLREIAAATGVSTFSARNVLGRVASRRPAAADGVTAADSAVRDSGDGDGDADALVPVLPRITSRTVSSPAATSRAIAGTSVPDADAMMIIARRTRTGSCLPRRTICSSRCPS
jgi:lambda repressor-like predicted transcriptional regulator